MSECANATGERVSSDGDARIRGWPAGTAAFVLLSLATVVVPLAGIVDVLGWSDVLYVGAVFALVLIVELAVLRVVLAIARSGTRQRSFARAWLALAFAVNAASFVAPLLNASIPTLLLIIPCAGVISWYFFGRAATRRALAAFAVLYVAIAVGHAAYSPAASSPDDRGGATPVATQGEMRSIFVFGFDALVSGRGLVTLFGVHEHPTREVLDALGFAVHDTYSPGDHTLATYGRMFMLAEPFNHTIARTFFNGVRPVPLYERLRRDGARVQFLYATEYFGVDAHRLDYFYPDRATPFICEFVDVRYGLFACRLWFRKSVERFLGIRLVARYADLAQDDDVEFERILQRYAAAAASGETWFSFAHLWFPGHTALDYRFDDAEAAQRYRSRYLQQLDTVSRYTRRLVQAIRERDPRAVIVILGDHGAGLTRGGRVGSTFDGALLDNDVIELDRRGVLLGVYPRDFCAERIARLPDTAALFAVILDCAEAARRDSSN